MRGGGAAPRGDPGAPRRGAGEPDAGRRREARGCALYGQGVRVRKIGELCKILQIFGGLVLDCIKTKDLL